MWIQIVWLSFMVAFQIANRKPARAKLEYWLKAQSMEWNLYWSCVLWFWPVFIIGGAIAAGCADRIIGWP